MLLMQLTAAHGPAECEYAVRLTLQELQRACARDGLPLLVLECNASAHGFQSVLLQSEHPQAQAWFQAWLGTIQWIFTSPMRPHHPRKNWFVALQLCPQVAQLPCDGEIVFATCRASGKGGQHVNTTDSAVHATHVRSGISVKVMTERSQHANKRLARSLIAMKLAQKQACGEEDARKQRTQQHWAVERGKPVKIFRV
ncbi:peptide chain release factor H [Lampropedia puyangensis]|uniref:Peptide chain release factor H n=1 Tax=Lampropedia puyangensis TaxID=1330072 RepID=A0A4S8F8U1_9BURK|nr:peptide chain release factor H [Lampropedia puyangensis]THU04018.1 peptide chain release factor H [Lampropedia puyangensis]